MAGAPAYFKPKINDSGISFTVCDERGSAASAKYVRLKPGWTLELARAQAMLRWDGYECERVIKYNTELAVCWARSRLLMSLRAFEGVAHLAVTHDIIAVNTDELVKLVTCTDKMEELAMLDESARIAKARAVRKSTLKDMWW